MWHTYMVTWFMYLLEVEFMINKQELEIGDEVKHNILGKGTFTETCFALEKFNTDPTSVFIYFEKTKEEKEVSLKLCELIEFEVPRLCQKCMVKLKNTEFNICKNCALLIKAKLVPNLKR